MENNSIVNQLRTVLSEEVVQLLSTALSAEELPKVAQEIVDHTLQAKAALTYDFNAAVNAIVRNFPGRQVIYVTEIHNTLRDLGITDYDASDFAYIEQQLKRLGILVEPDPKR